MKTVITIVLAAFGLGIGYLTSLAKWDKLQEAALGFVIAFVVSMLILIGYNASVSEGTEIRNERVLVKGEYFVTALIAGIMACVLPLLLK